MTVKEQLKDFQETLLREFAEGQEQDRSKTMTVEERAKTVTDEVGIATTGAELRALIVQALRDQIEDCAKAVDEQEGELTIKAGEIKRQSGLKAVNQAAATQLLFAVLLHKETGEKIRALAGEKEGDDVQDKL